MLPVAQYDLAELVFRQFISADAKSVFCLGYGTNYSPLPKEFIARFKAQNAIIRGEPDAITVVSNKIVLDKFTRREAIEAWIFERFVSRAIWPRCRCSVSRRPRAVRHGFILCEKKASGE